MERNLCKETGCKGFCCEDIQIEATIFERQRLFPGAKRLDTLEELGEQKLLGVYYTRLRRKHLGNNGFVAISINGPCPHRKIDGTCDVHSERSHAARNFKIGSEECNKIRKEHNLSLI